MQQGTLAGCARLLHSNSTSTSTSTSKVFSPPAALADVNCTEFSGELQV